MRKGQRVSWSWGQGRGEGEVVETFARRVSRTLKGSRIVRNGTSDDPACLIRQDDGDEVLKLASELDGE